MANTNIYAMTDSWNNAGVVFTAIQMNVTDTASQVLSLLLDLQVGGSSKFNVRKDGSLTCLAISAGGQILATGSSIIAQLNLAVQNDTGKLYFGAASDLALARDAANILAQQNGINAQTFRVYQTFTDTLNYARAALNNTVGQVELAAESAGTGTANIDIKLTPKGTGNVALPGGTLLKTTAALTNGAGAGAGTISNAPAAGNPTKWIPISDAGVTRYIPAW